MKKQVLTIMMASLMASTAFGATPTTVLEKTNALVTTVYGAVQEGAIVDRVNQLDATVYGAEFSSTSDVTLDKKVGFLYNSVEGSGSNVSLTEEMDALEYTYQNFITSGSLINRLDRMERSVNGKVSTGSLQRRIASLRTKIGGSNVKLTNQIGTLESTQVFKVKLNDDISTKTNKVGDPISFTVVDNIKDGNVLLVPAGTVGAGTITALKKARSFGRNATLDMVFESVPTIDGGAFTAIQGSEAKDKTKSELTAAGASVAGAVLLGPVGLVGGMFVKGKSIEYPAGTEIYVQPQETVTIQGLVIGGDGLVHNNGELADAVTTTTTINTNQISADETVNENKATVVDGHIADMANDTASTDAIDTSEVENVSQPIVVVKRT